LIQIEENFVNLDFEEKLQIQNEPKTTRTLLEY
jgi:hypothetical protein